MVTRGVQIALRLLPGGGVLESSQGLPPAPGDAQAIMAVQLARFFDSATDYPDAVLAMLRRSLAGAPADHRARFYNQVRACRRRPQVYSLPPPHALTPNP